MTDDTVQPLVSVCIPTYNRADRLARAVLALQNSTYSNLEIIISDNGSPDHTEAICRALAEADPRIRYYRHLVNLGPTHNFNFAKSMATGKYFLWHGDDDFIDSDYIERCVARLEQDAKLILVAGLSAYRVNKVSFHYGNVIQLRSRLPLLRVLRYIWQVLDNSIFCGVYRRVPLADLVMPNVLAGDWVWLASVAWRGRAEVLTDLHIHRDHGDTTSSSLYRICRVLGLSANHARLSWLSIARNLARLLVLDTPSQSSVPLVSQLATRSLVAIVGFFKFPIQKFQRFGGRCIRFLLRREPVPWR